MTSLTNDMLYEAFWWSTEKAHVYRYGPPYHNLRNRLADVLHDMVEKPILERLVCGKYLNY